MNEPRTLLRWGLFRFKNSGPYLAGIQDDGLERTSTPLIVLDREQGTAVTASGRPYHLAGEPDAAFGLDVARRVLSLYYNLGNASMSALTVDEAVAFIKLKGNALYKLTPGERAEIARQLGIQLDENGEVPPYN